MKVPNRILKTVFHLANGTSKDGKSVITPEDRAAVLEWATLAIERRAHPNPYENAALTYGSLEEN